MMISLILIVSFLSKSLSTEVFYKQVDIVQCGSTIDSATELQSEIDCVETAKKLKLGKKANLVINSVTYDANEGAKIENLCQKPSTDDYQIDILQKVKRIIFTVNGVTKAILSSSGGAACPTDIDVSEDELKKGFIYVESIKCIPDDYLAEFKKNYTKEGSVKPYVEKGTKLCFLNPVLVKKPVELVAKVNNADVKVTISAFKSIQDCPKCVCENKEVSTNNTNAQQSGSTTTIIIVVVVIVVIVLGGVGFVFLKK